MLRRAVFVAVVGLMLVATAVAAPGKLRVTNGSQFSVRGTSFHPRERVLVVVSAPGQDATKRVTAGPLGGFVAQFPTIEIGPCDAYKVTAKGNLGTRAALSVRPPECPEPPTQ